MPSPGVAEAAGTGAPASAPQDGSTAPSAAKAPVTVSDYVRPPAKETAGLTRGHHDEDEPTETVLPAAEPFFSNEGVVRQAEAEADRRRRKRQPFVWLAGAVGGLVILALLFANRSSLPGPINNLVPGGGVAAASGGPAEAIQGASVEDDPSSEEGIPNLSPGAGGSFQTYPPGSSPKPSGGPGWSPGPSDSASPGWTAGPTATPTDSPTDTPSGSPTATPSSTSTAPSTPTPTPAATPTPVVTPTPAPTFSVRFEPSGAITVPSNAYFSLTIVTLQGATCYLSVPGHDPSPSATAPGSGTITWSQVGKDTTPPKKWWPTGDYAVTAICSLSGHSDVTTQKVVHIT
jgi:hypothetical protein